LEKLIINDPMFPNPLVSHAVRVGNLIFTGGQTAFDPATGKSIGGDIRTQTHRVIQNLALVLQASGSDLEHAVKATVFLSRWEDFDAFNEVYRQYFATNPPGRTTTQAGRLGLDFVVEIDLIAVASDGG
jgi:2-iminobutanoate/2-iminopropanoate deaminase